MSDETKALLTAIVEFSKALIWPAFLALLFFRFRSEVAGLLARLGSVKVGDNEFVFQGASEKSEKIVEASEQIEELELRPSPDGFLSVVTLRKVVDNSGLLDAGDRTIAELLLFHTPEQKTWIVATKANAFILLDDAGTRKENRLIQTFFDKDKLLPIQTRISDGATVVRFSAEDTWWYYSNTLFTKPRYLEEAVRRLKNA